MRLECKSVRRITPAWAGKRPHGRGHTRRHEDYPRVGGEEGRPGEELLHERGLPPRGRGRGFVASGLLGAGGITPAWAGKSIPVVCTMP